MDGAARQGGLSRRVALICFSHLRWHFVFQRPQHLMTWFARQADVIFWEEPIERHDIVEPCLELVKDISGVLIARPIVPRLEQAALDAALRELLDRLLMGFPRDIIAWYYTPMMLKFTADMPAYLRVYDCMDELAQFRFAPHELPEAEGRLLKLVDLVLTGGPSLFREKSGRHRNVHCFPSSVDVKHFGQSRKLRTERRRLTVVQGPHFGFFGVLDERLDTRLIAEVAEARPDWTLTFVGPMAKISLQELPQRCNIHYPGPADYADLPAVSADWDVALMPFARNEATEFISPTKTPEYLAAGLPVVSTPIRDVEELYGGCEAVSIAGGTAAFIAACEEALSRSFKMGWLGEVDALLSRNSWESTAAQIWRLIEATPPPVRPSRNRAPGKRYDILVVGAGFAGSVMAERFAADAGKRVLVIDSRDHIGGNAYDQQDSTGILIHRYGPHIFHTNSQAVVDYLSRFTEWRPYEHRVRAAVKGQLVPIPINRTTLNQLYGTALESDTEAADFLARRAVPVADIRTSEDVVVAAVGRELYELFFAGYTRKQWGCDPSDLGASVAARVPARTNCDDRYFLDRFQAMPARGYTAMFDRMLDHPNIDIAVSTSFDDVRHLVDYDLLVYTGPLDEYFDFRYGKLPYRSMHFVHETKPMERFQPVAVVNYPDERVPYTRITEYKHLTGQIANATSVTYEYPSATGDPFYPIPNDANAALCRKYETLARGTPDALFVGRLATYRYYNMDQVVGQALATYTKYRERTENKQHRLGRDSRYNGRLESENYSA